MIEIINTRMARNLYEVLGVPETASRDEIKKAYRQKARESHPDRGGSDAAFKEVNDAYSGLRDDVKKERRQGAPAGLPPSEDEARMRDLRANIANADRPKAVVEATKKIQRRTPEKSFWDLADEYAENATTLAVNTGRVGGGALAGVGAAAAATAGAVSRFGGTFFGHLYTLTMHPEKFFDQIGSRYKEDMAKPPKGKGIIKGFVTATGWTLFGDKPYQEEKREKKKEEKKEKR